MNGVTRPGIAERVGEIEEAKGRKGGGKRSNHDEMVDVVGVPYAPSNR